MMIRKNSIYLLLLSVVGVMTFLGIQNRRQIGLWKRDISDNYLILSKSKPEINDKSPSTPSTPPSKPQEPELDPCTVINPLSNGFFDLRALSNMDHEDGLVPSWPARGWDYGMNFTLGICSTPLKKSHVQENDFTDISNTSLVGGYYTDAKGAKHSIGDFSQRPVFRGRKLVLQYEGGSFCRETVGGEKLRKSTILTFSCDRQIMAKLQVSFVGVLHDCDYFFDVKTVHACPTALKEDNLALVWIFALIFLAALFVFCGAGTLYRRLGRRSWKPLPSSHGLLYQVKNVMSGGPRRSATPSVSLNNVSNQYLDILDEEDDEEEQGTGFGRTV